jgi:4a-hydroxytetrahydrobiopterin dehydratase
MNWIEKENKLYLTEEFKDFKEAWAFLNKVAVLAEAYNHHPEIENVYNKVTLKLCTHDAGNSITEKDRVLAKEIDLIKL